MARYKLLTDSYIPRGPMMPDERLPPGTEIEFNGIPGSNLELISGKPADELTELKRKAASLRVRFPADIKADELRKLIKQGAADKVT